MTVSHGYIVDAADPAGGYPIVDVTCDGLTVSWDPAEPSRTIVLDNTYVELTPAKVRALIAVLAHPAVRAWLAGAE